MTSHRAARGLGLHAEPLPRLLSAADAAAERPTSRGGALLAVDVGGTLVRAALADSTGTIVAERTEPTDGDRTDPLLHQLQHLLATLRTDAGLAAEDVRSGAVGCPAVLHPATGAAQLSPNVPGMVGDNLVSVLEETLGLTVNIENDVNLAAAGERWRGAAGCDDFVFLNLGTGIGAGLVLGGDVYRGGGGAGELAHLPFGRNGLTAPQVAAAFEDSVSPLAMVRRWRALAGDAASADSRALLRAAVDGDRVARHVLDEQAELLAAGVAALTAVLDPPLVVVGGGLGSDPALVAALRERLDEAVRPVRIVPTALCGRAGLLGALLLALGSDR
ncbi:MAG: ROK family protein [Streptosporangiales bacterium]